MLKLHEPNCVPKSKINLKNYLLPNVLIHTKKIVKQKAETAKI